jgi:hypothetical protein
MTPLIITLMPIMLLSIAVLFIAAAIGLHLRHHTDRIRPDHDTHGRLASPKTIHIEHDDVSRIK